METITQYKTNDGKLFDDAEKAKAHEAELPKKTINFNLTILKKYNQGATFEEALALSNKKGKPLLTNLQADVILKDDELCKQYKDLFPCWTGDIALYERPDTPFKEYIKDPQSGWVFDVPKRYQGKKDMVLVLQQKYFKIESGKYDMKTVKATKVDAIPFPTKNGWYIPDSKFGIPTGNEVDSDNPKARYLYRITDSDPIRPLVRGDVWNWLGRRYVVANYAPAYRFGVGVVNPSPAKKK